MIEKDKLSNHITERLKIEQNNEIEIGSKILYIIKQFLSHKNNYGKIVKAKVRDLPIITENIYEVLSLKSKDIESIHLSLKKDCTDFIYGFPFKPNSYMNNECNVNGTETIFSLKKENFINFTQNLIYEGTNEDLIKVNQSNELKRTSSIIEKENCGEDANNIEKKPSKKIKES